jgi:hypothetical protein
MNFSRLIGETIVDVRGLTVGSGCVTFVTESGRKYTMQHEQDCCESVAIVDVVGDIADLLGTQKGTVTISWFGSSNGYYSERVDFDEVSYLQ